MNMKTKHDSRILNSIFSVLQYFCIIFLHSMFLQYLIIFSSTQIFYTQYFYTQYLYTIFTLIFYTHTQYFYIQYFYLIVLHTIFLQKMPGTVEFEIPNLIFTRIPFLFRDEGGVAHPPPSPEYARTHSGFHGFWKCGIPE